MVASKIHDTIMRLPTLLIDDRFNIRRSGLVTSVMIKRTELKLAAQKSLQLKNIRYKSVAYFPSLTFVKTLVTFLQVKTILLSR